MVWWIWVILGIVLLALEIATPSGFWISAFGVAGILVGILVAIGIGGPAWVQWSLFGGLSVAMLLIARPWANRTYPSTDIRDRDLSDLIGKTAFLPADLAPGDETRIELQGSTWTARNAAPTTLPGGRRCRVQRVEGLTLWVGPE